MRITFLGTGTSTGVPVIACDCSVCTSQDQHNHRTRASLLVQDNGRSIIIDTAPDLRQQALRTTLRRLDAVLFTHAHADHVGGLDDLRGFNLAQRAAIPCFGDEHTIRDIQNRYPYIFNGHLYFGAKPELTMQLADSKFQLFDLEVVPIRVYHGWLPVLGYRIGRIAYVTDCNAIPAESLEALKGLDVLVLGALRHQPHPSHFTIAEAVEVVKELRPRQAYFTHIGHELDYQETNRILPPGVELAYDGLTIDLP
ncbi:MAG: MBL fold metallo-hydrolase [Dehalococcoidia bacterium]|nr:MBL fold metallo-hydrolase [Dehalococcoidia bacterium]